MATVTLSEEIRSVVDAEVREHGFANASEYISKLVCEDQRRQADEKLVALAIEGLESGDPVEMTAQSWRDLRLELHRQAGIP